MTKGRVAGIGILGLAIGYFAWYVPYSALVKALSSGAVPGVDEPVGGLVLLPATAIGQLVAMPIFLSVIGWWRYARRRTILGRQMIFPGREMLWAGFWMALIIGTTTLNYTFIGASILLMVLIMRGGTLTLSPIVDTLRKRPVHRHSWVALILSLTAVAVALGDVDSYVLGVGGVLSVCTYLAGYTGRFTIMSKVAKTGDQDVDRRYFVEEHIVAPMFLLVLCAIPAILGLGAWGNELREGFTSFLTTPAVLPALGIGMLYEALFIFGTFIYLDPREYTWAVPANRCSSLFAGVVAAFALTALTDIPRPGNAQLIAMIFIIMAVTALSWPTIMAMLAPRGEIRRLLFVCGGNTCRSPLAAAIAAHEMEQGDSSIRWEIASAGVAVDTPGAPLTAEAATALRELGVVVPEQHEAQQLTAQMCTDTYAVYCMTQEQRDAVIALAPQVADRTYRLDAAKDVPDPMNQPLDAYRGCVSQIQTAVRGRLTEQRENHAMTTGVKGG